MKTTFMALKKGTQTLPLDLCKPGSDVYLSTSIKQCAETTGRIAPHDAQTTISAATAHATTACSTHVVTHNTASAEIGCVRHLLSTSHSPR